jgi:hypothetical protein
MESQSVGFDNFEGVASFRIRTRGGQTALGWLGCGSHQRMGVVARVHVGWSLQSTAVQEMNACITLDMFTSSILDLAF